MYRWLDGCAVGWMNESINKQFHVPFSFLALFCFFFPFSVSALLLFLPPVDHIRAAVPVWGQTGQILSRFVPKRGVRP